MPVVLNLASLVIALTLLVTPASAMTKQPIRWGTDSWPEFTHTDGTGFYHDLIRAVLKDSDYALKVEYMNWPRVEKALEEGQIDMSGAVKKDGTYHYSKMPILEQEILVLAPSELLNNNFINNLPRLTGAWRKGYRHAIVEQSSLRNLYGVELDTPQTALKLISNRRIDYYIDIRSIINQLDRSTLAAMHTKPVGHFKLYWAFARNEQGLALKHSFDKALEQLRQQGELQKLYHHYKLSIPW